MKNIKRFHDGKWFCYCETIVSLKSSLEPKRVSNRRIQEQLSEHIRSERSDSLYFSLKIQVKHLLCIVGCKRISNLTQSYQNWTFWAVKRGWQQPFVDGTVVPYKTELMLENDNLSIGYLKRFVNIFSNLWCRVYPFQSLEVSKSGVFALKCIQIVLK